MEPVAEDMRSACVAAVLAGMAMNGAMAAEAKPAPPAQGKVVEPVDVELLEFLGSLDTEEEEWREYLESRPVKEAAGKPEQKAPTKPAAKQPAPKQQEKVKKP
jgi:hypothetical protein